MPLKDQPTQRPYIDRKRIYVSSHNANSNNDGSGRWNISDYVAGVNGHPSNVSSIELTGYIMPELYSPVFPFPEQEGVENGSRYLDILMVDPLGTYPDYQFTAEMPYTRKITRINTPENTISYLVDIIEEAMGSTHPVFRESETTWSAVYDVEFTDGTYGGVSFTAETRAQFGVSPAFTPEITFLFGTGPNANNSPWYELGFEQGVDAGPTTLPSGNTPSYPSPSRLYNFWTFRYVNINLAEIPEFNPHSRIFLTPRNVWSNNNNKAIDGVRLLTQPPRRLDTLNVLITLRNGTSIHPLANDPNCLTFDLLLSVPEIDVPSWIVQRLEY